MIKIKLKNKGGNWKGKPSPINEEDLKLASQFSFDT